MLDLDKSSSTAKTAEGAANTAGLEPAYLPRFGQYHFAVNATNDGSLPLFNPSANASTNAAASMASGVNRVQTQDALLDMDSLMHESAFTADKPKHVDNWSFLRNALTYIPGSASNDGAYSHGANDIFMDEDVKTANNVQQVAYVVDGRPTTAADALRSPRADGYTYATVSFGRARERDYFQFVTGPRIEEARVTTAGSGELVAEEGPLAGTALAATPLVWSQTRVHLQKAWLAGSPL